MGSTGTSTLLKVGNRQVSLSNLAKTLYPSGFTKGEVAEYYVRIGPTILPYLKGRAVTWKRYPNGTASEFFFEKRCPSHKPDWVRTAGVSSRRNEGTVQHCVIDDMATLLWAANLAALELHTPLALAAKPNRPTAMVFDLDPGPPATLLDCLRLSLTVRDRLKKLGLKCFPKTSGGKGLHLYVPLNTAATFDQTKAFARGLADQLVADDPAHVTANMSKALRGGKIFVDWSQNDDHKTTVCAYSLRAGATPTVSTPITWIEVEAALSAREPEQLRFDPGEVIDRVEERGDAFAPILQLKQKLPELAALGLHL